MTTRAPRGSAPPLRYREAAPPSEAIEAVWSLDVDADGDGPGSFEHVVLPDGCLDLIFRARRGHGGRLAPMALMVVGPMEQADIVSVTPGDVFLGLRFRPGWGGICLGVDPAGLLGQVVAAHELSSDLRQLSRGLAEEAPRAAAFATLRRAGERWADGRRPCARVLQMVELLRHHHGRIGIDEAARRAGASPRTIRREVTAAVGLSPKALGRIFRFRHTLALRRDGAAPSLAALAHDGGYADQAHMTREFADLGGFTPSRVPALHAV